MNGPLPPYMVQPGDVERDRDAVLAIWRGNLGEDARMTAKYEWFYRRCPFGAPLLELLYHHPSGAWVGACSMGRRRMLWCGTEIRGGLLVDLAVMPKHRSLGPALMMQMGLVESAREQLDLTLGFPNPKAASVFKRIRYEKFSDMVRRVRVLRHGPYLRRRMPAWLAAPAGALVDLALWARDAWRGRAARALEVQWSARAVQDIDELWSRSRPSRGLLGVRDLAFVRWRFDESPLEDTRYMLLRERGSGQLLAWFATDSTDSTLHVRDYWSTDSGVALGARYVDALLGAARARGFGSISVSSAGSPARVASWISRGFVERSRRPVFGYWSQPPNQLPRDLDIHLTNADEDE